MPEWNLGQTSGLGECQDLFKRLDQCAKQLDELELSLKAVPEYEQQEILCFLLEYEKIAYALGTVEQRVSLLFAKNVLDNTITHLRSACLEQVNRCSYLLESFKVKQLLHIEATTLEPDANNSTLSSYSYFLQKTLRRWGSCLSEEDEQGLALLKTYCRDALADVYTSHTNNYVFNMQAGDVVQQLDLNQVLISLNDPNRDRRMAVRKAFFARYKRDRLFLEGIYCQIVKQYNIEANIRGFSSPISVKNHENDLDDEVTAKIIKIIDKNLDIAHQYFRWKSGKLGCSLSQADLGFPHLIAQNFSFSEATEMVLAAFCELDQVVGEIARSIFKESRVDSDPARSKRKGAFCFSSVPDAKPYVLINYNGLVQDVLTLAHEVGHAIHRTLSSRQSYINYAPSLLVSETVAGFSEIIVWNEIQRKLAIADMEKLMVFRLENFIFNTFNTNVITRFEQKAHSLIRSTGKADFADLCSIYVSELQTLHGSWVSLEENAEVAWARYPHVFKQPFYIFAYSFASLSSLALYQSYLKRPGDFRRGFNELMAGGSSESPQALFAKLDVDISDPAFWQESFDYVKQTWLQQLMDIGTEVN